MTRLFLRRYRPLRESIRRRQAERDRAERLGGLHVEDFILGANDGVITTFAVIAGATGGGLGSTVILILGFANLFADAISMGASNYLGKRSGQDYVKRQRQMEEWEIKHVPEQEREEVRRIFRDKGLESEQLDLVVNAITEKQEAWLDVMMALELGLTQDDSPPIKNGLATFSAFAVAGLVPLLPYAFGCNGTYCFAVSAAAGAVALFVAGALRILITGVNWIRGGLEMLGVGSAAALVAYVIGHVIANIV